MVLPRGQLPERRLSRASAAILGGVAVIIGSLLPWASVATAFGSITVNGTDGDGVLTLIAGAILAIAGVVKNGAVGKASGQNVLIILASIAAGLIAIYDMSNITTVADNPFASVSVGAGLYVVVIGAVIGLFGASGEGGKATPVKLCPHCKEMTSAALDTCTRCGRIASRSTVPPPPPEV